jgi:hypothetical protein
LIDSMFGEFILAPLDLCTDFIDHCHGKIVSPPELWSIRLRP